MAKLTAEIISADLLKEQSGSEVFARGLRLFRTKKVIIERVLEDAARCRVKDNETHLVSVNLTDQYLYLKCDCIYASKGFICEHDVAGALALQDHLRKYLTSNWQNQISKIVKSTQNTNKKQLIHPYLLFFSIQNASTRGLINWKVIPYYMPLLGLPKEIRAQVELIKDAEIKDFFKKHPRVQAHLKPPYQTLHAESCINGSEHSVLLANILADREKNFSSSTLPLFDILRSLSLSGNPIYLGNEIDPLDKIVHIINEPADLRINLSKEKSGLQISACINLDSKLYELSEGDLQLISYDPFIILFDNYIFKVSDPNQVDLLKTLSDNPFIFINDNYIPEFLEKYYQPLANQIQITGDVVKWEILEQEPKARIYLLEKRGEIQAELRYLYGEYEVPFDSVFPEQVIIRQLNSWKLIKILRSPSKEEKLFNSLSSKKYGLKRAINSPKTGVLDLRARTHPVDFLLRSIPMLIKDGHEIFGEDLIQATRVNRNNPSIFFDVSSGIDWFDVKISIKFGDTTVSLKELKRVIKKKEQFIKLSDGTIGEIPQDWIEKYKHLVTFGEEVSGSIRLGNQHVSLIDQILQDSTNFSTDEKYSSYLIKFQKLLSNGRNGIESRQIPEHFQGDLRPYQRHGFNWLHYLREFNFGGCLADDMGLGKTIQTLVFLQSIYTQPGEDHPPTLLVVPKSLIANWQREASRFVPGLKFLEYIDSNRPDNYTIFSNYHLVITTYGIMLRDVQKLKTFNFEYIILDESQIIKNPSSQTSRAARSLISNHKLVLTGTPVENSTIELWSQFSFLNPGLLGNLDYFKREFAYPIEKKGDDESTLMLKKLVSPFILRRTKDQVAPELPPRTEKVIFSDMEPAQRKLYNRTREYYRTKVLGLLSENGNDSRMQILEGLLRLRQICNHPVLFDHNFRGESGKLNLIKETLDTLRSEGHKALVFSQFVQMLTVIRNTLDKSHVPYTYIDGQTQNRQEIVDQFQENEHIPFFLISLKAGGLGLNLTAADYVLHIDPWWNPAVEMQATDRTHRIGQDKPVFVYKLITRDSVEEKIVDLQDKKRELVDQLITPENGFFKNLTQEEIESLFI